MDIKDRYYQIAAWLMSWGADRWLHLLGGLVAGFLMAWLCDGPLWLSLQVGFVTGFVIGMFKECLDTYYNDNGDGTDLVFTLLGGVIGGGMYGIFL